MKKLLSGVLCAAVALVSTLALAGCGDSDYPVRIANITIDKEPKSIKCHPELDSGSIFLLYHKVKEYKSKFKNIFFANYGLEYMYIIVLIRKRDNLWV